MILLYKSSWTTASALEKMVISRNRVGMAMDADSVIDPAMVRKIDGSFSWIDHSLNTGELLHDLVSGETLLRFFLITASDRKDLNFYQNDNTCTLQETDMPLMRSISDGLISRLLPSFRSLSDASFFSDDLLFCCGEKG
jgi:hypothetical protein